MNRRANGRPKQFLCGGVQQLVALSASGRFAHVLDTRQLRVDPVIALRYD